MAITAGTLFSGGGGADIGLMQAGVEILWGNEYIDEIAVHNESQLKHKIYKCSILDLDPTTLPKVDILHASPPCPSFSVANKNKGETENDLALSHKVAEFIEVLRPKVFTLENVWGYRNSESWRIIAEKLNEVYGALSWEIEHINFADAGVPQARKRMMVRAVAGLSFGIAQIHKPTPVQHVGWFAAVEDIIDTFPDSKFADWQLKRLNELPEYTFLMESSTAGDREIRLFLPEEPADTLRAGGGGRVHRARIYNNDGTFRDFALTIQGQARFQSFPNWYELPEKKTLAITILGNSVPPLGYQWYIQPIVDFIGE